MEQTIFINKEKEKLYRKEGCVSFPILSQQEIMRLKALCTQMDLADKNTYTTEQSPEIEEKKRSRLVRDEIFDIVMPVLGGFLQDMKPVMASFMIKEPNSKSFIPPHQDCALADEEQNRDTVFCWIPLVDTNLNNGAIGVIKGSHAALRSPSPPWPNPRTPRYQDENVFDLFPYLSIFELNAGEGVFFNNKTLHGSLPNLSTQNRLAIRIGMIHKEDDILNYYLKPNSGKQSMCKYKVNADFYIEYPNERLVQIYDKGELLDTFDRIDELPYFLSDCSIEQLIDEIREMGIAIEKNEELLPGKEQVEKKEKQKLGMLKKVAKFLNLD